MPANGLARLSAPATEMYKSEPRIYVVSAYYMLTLPFFVT